MPVVRVPVLQEPFPKHVSPILFCRSAVSSPKEIAAGQQVKVDIAVFVVQPVVHRYPPQQRRAHQEARDSRQMLKLPGG